MSSFWKLGFHTPKSPLEALLEKDEVSLEEVLDQDDLLQEAKSGNEKVVNFLAQTKEVRKLLEFTTSPVPDDDPTIDDRRRFKYPYISCELLVSDIPMLYTTLVEPGLLHQLFSFLEQPPPLPSSLSLFFVRVLQTLYSKKTAEITEFMSQQDGGLALNFIKHIETYGMNELMLILLGTMDDEDHCQIGNGTTLASWWMGHGFVNQLFDRLTSGYSSDVHINIIRMLCELVRRFHNPNITCLADRLMSAETAGNLLSLMLADLKTDSKSIIFTEGINLLISVIDSLVRREDMNRNIREEVLRVDGTHLPVSDDVETQIALTFTAILDRTSELVAFLKDPGHLAPLELTWTTLQPPLGMARLKTVELLLVLLKTKKPYVEDLAVELDLINICLDLFFLYDMNNLLHILADEIVGSCLVSENQRLVTCLLEDCHILQRLLDAVADDINPERPKSQRKGYFGHITSISNKIIQAEDNQPIVKQHTQSNTEWLNFVSTTLASRNSTDNVVLGGVIPSQDCIMEDLPPTSSVTESLAELVESLTPSLPSEKYAPTSQEDIWANDQEAEEPVAQNPFDGRDEAFDARDQFADEELVTPAAEEDVWQERQIVDNSASEEDWGHFDEPIAVTAVQWASAATPDDSSSSDDGEEFVPSPIKATGIIDQVAAPVPQHDFNDFNFWRTNWGDVAA